MSEAIETAYAKAKQVGMTIYRLSQFAKPDVLLTAEAAVFYPSNDSDDSHDYVESEAALEHQIDLNKSNLLEDLNLLEVQLEELQKAFEEDSTNAPTNAKIAIRGWEKICLGNPKSCEYMILGPILSVARQTLTWAGQLYEACTPHYRRTDDGGLQEISLTEINLAGTKANRQVHVIRGQCPYGESQHNELVDRISNEHEVVIEEWRKLTNAGEEPVKQVEIKEEEKIHDLWCKAFANGEVKTKEEFLETKFDGCPENLKEFMRSKWNEEENLAKHKKDGTKEKPKSDLDVLKTIINTGLKQKTRGGRADKRR